MPLTTTRIRVSGKTQAINSEFAIPHQKDPYQRLSALELIHSCLNSGADEAWTQFVRQFRPLITGTVTKAIRRWTLPAPDLVEDLVQDTYVKLCADNFRPLRQFDCRHENALLGFLRAVAENVVQDHFRGSWCRKRGSGRAEETLDRVYAGDGESFARRIERTILLCQIQHRLEKQKLSHDHARNCSIFWLYYGEGFTAEAISQMPGMALSTKGVESTLLRLARIVKAELG